MEVTEANLILFYFILFYFWGGGGGGQCGKKTLLCHFQSNYYLIHMTDIN